MKLRTITWSKQLPAENQTRVAWWSLFRAWLPTLLLIGIVGGESTSFFGANRTGPFLYKIYFHFLGPTTFDRWWLIHMIIRKSGHILGFALLSASLFRTWLLTLRVYFSSKYAIDERLTVNLRWSAHLLAIFGALIVATVDEKHQTYLPNRTGSVRDVFIDLSAAVVAQLIIWFVVHHQNHRSRLRA